MPLGEGLTTASRVNFVKRCLILLAPFHLLLPAQHHLSQAAEPAWRTGAELERQLDSLVRRGSAAIPLRAALTNLARSQQVAVFLDRRVDPDQPVDFAVGDVPLRELLQRLAEQLKLGVGRVGPVVYLGPQPTAAVLGTVAALKEEEDQRFPADVRSRLRRPQPLGWPELVTPREVLQRWTDEAGVKVENWELIPHDLWPEVDLPPLSFAQGLTLVLAGFELTFNYAPDGAAVRLQPLPAKASITRRIPLRGSPTLAGAEIRRRFPSARFTIEGGSVVVHSTVEVADDIRRLLDGSSARPKPPPVTAQAEKRYSLHVKAPLGAIAAKIAENEGLQLRFDNRIQDLQDKQAWIDVQDVTLDRLLKTLLQPAGLTYQIDEQTLEIRPADSP